MTHEARSTDAIGGLRGVLSVIGHPVAHSLSPVMHGAALAALGLSDRIRYVARDVLPGDLPAFVHELREARLLGASVTLPHKRAVMSLCDRVEPDASAIGAVNTLVRTPDGTIVGVNTDAPGLGLALGEAGVTATGAHALVLGAGGAARAAVIALARAGAASISVAARRPAEAAALVASLEPSVPEVRLWTLALEHSTLAAHAATLTIVVQATSATLDAAAGTALAALVPFDALPADAVVCDLVYRPRRTAVLRKAEAARLRTVDGTGMLVHQGALALEHWLGVTAPISVMRDALNAALGRDPPLQT